MKTMTESLKVAEKIALGAASFGGRAYFVGGFVRDRLMNKADSESADIDIEVHGISPENLRTVLDDIGGRISIGESFGIYSLCGYNIDVAMPRTENATGRGHRDFETFVDPNLGVKKAAMRRDFTVNALMQDVLTEDIIDSFNGLSDLKNGIIRHVSDESFPEDPLRVLRCAQFSARFGFSVAPETLELCKRIPLDALSPERIDGELKKALLKSEKPSLFFDFLRDAGQLDYWFPEVKALIGVEQNPKYHPEGDVYVHTMMVLDKAAARRDKAQDPYAFMLSALCHDFGKPAVTKAIDGVIHSYNHENAGLATVKTFIQRITNEKKLLRYVLNMVELHMLPNVFAMQNVSMKSTNRMFDRSADPEGLIQLAVSDSLGMGSGHEFIPSEEFLEDRLASFRKLMEKPYVTGQDLIDSGLKPDEHFKEILEYAHKLRIAGIEKDSALRQTLGFAKQFR